MPKCKDHTTVGGIEDPEDKRFAGVTSAWIVYHDIFCPNCGEVAGRKIIREEN